jgi:hypothetical protein
MTLSAKVTDRLCGWAIYVAVGLVVLWGGIQLINYALEVKFYKDYLAKWEVLLEKHNSEDGAWPVFTVNDPSGYMNHLIKALRGKGAVVPRSNTDYPYVYRLDRLGCEDEKIVLLCLPSKIVLNGISERSFRRLDKWIDGNVDGKNGALIWTRGDARGVSVGELRL